jgi:hypothetical protein
MTCAKILTVILSMVPAMAMADVSASNPATAPATAPASAPPPQARAKVAYLGLAATTLDPATARQLNLPAGTGLRVFFVVPKSPADLAGLKVNDVLVKLDDQLLINLPQFTVLVRSFQPGRQTAMKIFRGAQEMTLTATLGQQEVLGPVPTETVETRARLAGMGPNSFQATVGNGKYLLKYAIEGGSKSLTVTDAKTGRVVFSGPVNTKEELDKAPQDVLPLLPKLQMDCKLLEPPSKFVPTQIVYSDAKYDMTLRVDNGKKFLTVKDKAGVTIFNGSVESPPQVQALAPEIQAKLKIMERSLQHVSDLGAPTTHPGS